MIRFTLVEWLEEAEGTVTGGTKKQEESQARVDAPENASTTSEKLR
jgi:hypothetical protein